MIQFCGTRESGLCAARPGADDDDQGRPRPQHSKTQPPLGAPERDHDEDDLEALEQDSLERDGEPVPVQRRSPVRSSRRGQVALPPKRLILVVQRLVAARAQDRFPQPLEPEHEKQRADDEPQGIDRDLLERRTEHGNKHARAAVATATPVKGARHPRTTPTPSTIVNASTISTALARKDPRTINAELALTSTHSP